MWRCRSLLHIRLSRVLTRRVPTAEFRINYCFPIRSAAANGELLSTPNYQGGNMKFCFGFALLLGKIHIILGV